MAVAQIADIKRLGGYSGPDMPELDMLRACVQCGMCLPVCPTYRLTGQEMSSPRGRIWMMNAVADGRLSLDDSVFGEQMYQCLDCRACEAVCPSGVQYGKILEASRTQIEQHVPRPTWQRAVRKVGLSWLFGDVSRLRNIVGSLRIYQRTGMSTLARRTGVLKAMGMTDLESMMPSISRKFLIPGTERWRPKKVERSAHLFNGCIMGCVFADTNRAAARVMAHNGTEVDVPVRQQCCGALHVHSGMFEDARKVARQNIDAFESSGDEPIIVTAAGCGSTLKEYEYLLKDDPDYAERASRFSKRVKDISEYLASIDLKPPTHSVNRTVTYQEPCHLVHAQRISEQPRQLLASIPGLKLIEMKESSLCCGSAGIYNITRRETANELGDRKISHALKTGASEIVTANPGCAMQLRTSLIRNHGTMDVIHIADLLDEAYGGEAATRDQTWTDESVSGAISS